MSLKEIYSFSQPSDIYCSSNVIDQERNEGKISDLQYTTKMFGENDFIFSQPECCDDSVSNGDVATQDDIKRIINDEKQNGSEHNESEKCENGDHSGQNSEVKIDTSNSKNIQAANSESSIEILAGTVDNSSSSDMLIESSQTANSANQLCSLPSSNGSITSREEVMSEDTRVLDQPKRKKIKVVS